MQSNRLFERVDDVLPHSGDMVLLTDILEWGESWLEAVVDHGEPSIFAENDGAIPVWVGIEYMAQAISALAGIRALNRGQSVKIGLLMGARKYQCFATEFARDSKLLIRIDEVYADDLNIGMFDCQIYSDNNLLAKAQIKAVQPEDPIAVIEGRLQ